MFRALIILLLPFLLSACGAESIWATDEAVARARYVSPEPPSITLFTVLRKRGEVGAHSGLMINGSQRIMYDPAGTWNHPRVPERNDVHYGITEQMRKFYIDYHARATYDVVEQKVFVSPEVAEMAIRLAEAEGAAPKAFCSNTISDILRRLPGFEPVGRTFFPKKMMEEFARLPGATKKRHLDGDPDNNSGVLMIQAGES